MFVGVVLALMVGLSVFGVGIPVAWGYTGVADHTMPFGVYNTGSGNFSVWGSQGETGGSKVSCGSGTFGGYPVGIEVYFDQWDSPYNVTGFFVTLWGGAASLQNDGLKHEFVWTGGYAQWSNYDCSVAGGSAMLQVPGSGYSGSINPYIELPPDPLTVEISGSGTVVVGVGGDWSAAGAGGYPGYTYAWTYGPSGPFNSYPLSGSTLSHDFAAGSWVVAVRVTDTHDQVAYDMMPVESGSDIVGYRIAFARSGTYGQYVTVIVYTGAGLVSPIASTSETEIGISEVNAGFGWYSALTEASWINLFWRWTLQFTVGIVVLYPPVDFWLRASITLTNTTVLSFNHHFSSTSEVGDEYVTDEGDPINPDIPPAPETVLPEWLQAVLDGLKTLLKYLWEKVVVPALQVLFVPTQVQIDQLMPTGSLGATLLEGTAWDSGDSTWVMHTHWGESEIVLVDVDFADLGAFGTAVKLIVQAGICLGLIYMVVVLL